MTVPSRVVCFVLDNNRHTMRGRVGTPGAPDIDALYDLTAEDDEQTPPGFLYGFWWPLPVPELRHDAMWTGEDCSPIGRLSPWRRGLPAKWLRSGLRIWLIDLGSETSTDRKRDPYGFDAAAVARA